MAQSSQSVEPPQKPGRFTLRAIIDDKRFGELNVNPAFGVGDLRAVPLEWRDGIPEYVKDYVPLNQFM
jgi:type I restriction enzyme R subunit